MKIIFRETILLCLTLSILLSTVACNVVDKSQETTPVSNTSADTTPVETEPEEPKEEDLYPEPIKQLLAENKPYSLEFTSNGDGTCYVSYLYLNNRYETMFDIIIPETSPTGDIVTGIDLGDSLMPLSNVIPQYLTWERAAKIADQVKADYPNEQNGKIREWWINAYFQYDVSNMSPGMREEVIKRYPILEYNTVIGVWYPKMSNTRDTFARIQYANITPSVTKQYYEEFIQEAREAGAPEEVLAPYKELIEALPAYANYTGKVQYLHIPSSVSSIDVESLYGLMLGVSRDSIRGVVLPELDLETTEAIGSVLAIGLSEDYNFFIFSQSTSAEGYEELSNFAFYSEEEPPRGVRAWRYVDGVPTLWNYRVYS